MTATATRDRRKRIKTDLALIAAMNADSFLLSSECFASPEVIDPPDELRPSAEPGFPDASEPGHHSGNRA